MDVRRSIREDGTIELGVEGELDLETAPVLREALVAAINETGGVWVDFANCSFMDSTGLRVIIEGARLVNEDQAKLGISGLREQPKQLFEITNLNQSDLLQFDTT
jgi:anti-sigma B factor antagonist